VQCGGGDVAARISDQSPLKRFINFITFVDIPIKKKFVLFAVGVLFWFLVMFVMSMATIIDINSRSDRIVDSIIPHDKVAQKMTRKLQSLDIDAGAIADAADVKILDQKIDLSKARIEDLKSLLTITRLGGKFSDIQRETGSVIESFDVESIAGDAAGEQYFNDLSPLIDSLKAKIEEIDDTKRNLLMTGQQDPRLEEKIKEYQSILRNAVVLSSAFSSKLAEQYRENSDKIKFASRCTATATTVVLFVATGLLVLFTVWISRSIANPVKSIINQIRALGEGEVDLTKRIDITSMTTFKKVIEEDESLYDVYRRLGTVFSDHLGLYDFTIYEVNNSTNKMSQVCPVVADTCEDMKCNEDILTNCNLCRAKKTGHQVSSLDYARICNQFRPDVDKEHVCFPLIIGGSTGGVVQFLLDKNTHNVADRRDRRLFKAEQFIKESLSVLEAKRLTNTLRESALKDPLTGLYNRRFLQEYTETLIAGLLRRKKNIGLIMCDLDYFKQVNDSYGHNVGDAILKETAMVIKKCVRDADMVIRFGGEEFLVVLIDIVEGHAISTAEKIRESMETTKIKVPDGVLTKTISLGISEFPIDTQGFWQAIKFADVALYRAKETGRNRSVRFTPDMWTEEEF
jgi:diguanylate cyclase (GGDEF)-like protein